MVFPGSRVHFFAANRRGVLVKDPDSLMERLRLRELTTQYVREYYLPFRLMPDRLEELENQLNSLKDSRINRDFHPVAYYLNLRVWSTQFHRSYLWLMNQVERIGFLMMLTTVLLISLLTSFLHFRKLPQRRRVASHCVWAMGFTMLAVEILLLLGFQAVYGYVYHRLALIVAAFMAGMALGCWLSRRRQLLGDSAPFSPLIWLQLSAAIFPLLLSGLLILIAGIENNTVAFLISAVIFPTLAFLSGSLGGYQFPLVSRLYYPRTDHQTSNPGVLYGLDVLGAWCASLLVSIIFFPLYGLVASALLIAAVNLGPVLLVATAPKRTFQVSG